MENHLNFRAIYKDTDAEGVVYYANYLGWFEAGRTEFIRDLGISLTELKEKQNLVFAVRDVNCRYLKPAVYDDIVRIETSIAAITGATITFDQKALRSKDAELLVDAQITLVALNIKTFKPAKMPKNITAIFSKR